MAMIEVLGGLPGEGAQPVMAPSSEGRIQLLDPHMVNQIAAGEVVERPASAVKELLENALDSGARRVVIDLIESGKRLIRVTDDGCGMSSRDAVTSLQRHATSKLRHADDLQAVSTLGFRGEALPSIASVSRLRLETAERDGARTVVCAEGGTVSAETGESGPQGTTVWVQDLFYNTPARLKFLKSDTTELGKCMDVVSRLAVSAPSVAITLTHNGQSVFETTGDGDPLDALANVWSRDLARSLAEVKAELGGIRLTGFVSPPHVTKPNRTYQYVFVNGRPVSTRTLTAAVDQAYRHITPERRFPVLMLNLDIDPAKIDINVSPTKSEVKFQHEGAAFEAIRVGIREALMAHGMMPSADSIAAVNNALAGLAGSHGSGQPGAPLATGGFFDGARGASSTFGAGVLRPEAATIWGEPTATRATEFGPDVSSHSAPSIWDLGGSAGSAARPSGQAEGATEPDFATIPAQSQTDDNVLGGLPPVSLDRFPFADLLEGLRVIGQAMETFIIAETRKGLILVDQHVAHERILYEYLCGLRGPTAIEKQPLLIPQTLTLERRSAVLAREKLDELRKLGFDLEPFGGESYVVRAAPAALRGKDPLRVLRDLIEELVENTVTRKLMPTRESLWIMSACKMAVKAGDPLSHAEMEKLLVDLASTENPYLCPHGRPITATLSGDALLRLFKRT